mmetsp:Transcript_115969/g.334897  ORF Transcript_115969/g.334897 Transcript_115969/m.334897 type:complete len:500 (-) Transcript_115969:226-1725(-)|eukprot:CAMPEP_0176011128 /NCGR_PEP_ID=MMETSP0120_2-20121206/5125_1 /TAXON_ID=160619 /ORGANISM="Kryptoperidinium foliaceum, Strain CCMP 1326" /LENGTH=499 /DNA_ID=CAMNT_0017343983 /DNA_START=64 /DNA_END=1563 /DNA_ORIENTATION=+
MGYNHDAESTDEESGIHEIADILRNVDVRTVSSASANQGFETSFLMIEGRRNGDHEDGEGYGDNDESWKEEWLCKPYKREKLWEEIMDANHKGVAGHAAILNTLKNLGVMIFLIDAKVSTNTADILESTRNVLHHVCKEARDPSGMSSNDAQRCLLYRDTEGRFFNLLLDDHSSNLAKDWESHLTSFSCLQAASLLMVLSRSFACITQENVVVDSYAPAYFAVLLGVVFKEEISNAWTNVGMSVRGFPSISAYSVSTYSHSDWLRKVIVFALLFSSMAGGTAMHVSAFVGISLAMMVLLANLGSRTWGFMQWRPIQHYGIFEPIISFFMAVLTGLLFPFLGHRQVESGGKVALERTFGISMLSAIAFVVSDYDNIQKYLVIGSEQCNQDWIVLIVGVWWAIASICSLFTVFRKERRGIWPEDEEPLLEKDHRSPVGFKVPNLPDFPLNSIMARKGVMCLTTNLAFIAMLVVTIGMGGFLSMLAFTDYEDNLDEKISGSN